MINLLNDYSTGANPEILKKLEETNLDGICGYGLDDYCKSGAQKIQAACGCPEADVYFMVGGTQTNQVVIDTMCMPYEGVICVTTGHPNSHEAGAVEYSGHKILTLPEHDGKMCANELKNYIVKFYKDSSFDHMVFPGMVYISHPTELGTLYTKDELKALHEVCREYDIPLYMDGARLAYGLMAEGTDVTLKDIAELTDVFYIGGTKCGALMGEAVVFTRHNMPKHFNTQVKQHGAMLAKGWLLGLQFDTLFTDNLYLKGAKNAIIAADALKKTLKDKGYEFFIETPANQIFVIVSPEKAAELSKKVSFGFWDTLDDGRCVIRFVTNWATTMEEMNRMAEIL